MPEGGHRSSASPPLRAVSSSATGPSSTPLVKDGWPAPDPVGGSRHARTSAARSHLSLPILAAPRIHLMVRALGSGLPCGREAPSPSDPGCDTLLGPALMPSPSAVVCRVEQEWNWTKEGGLEGYVPPIPADPGERNTSEFVGELACHL